MIARSQHRDHPEELGARRDAELRERGEGAVRRRDELADAHALALAEPQHRAGACWYELASEKGEPYYWHSESGETSWEPPAWTKEADPKSGHDYFLHAASGESRWELPAGAAALVHGEP